MALRRLPSGLLREARRGSTSPSAPSAGRRGAGGGAARRWASAQAVFDLGQGRQTAVETAELTASSRPRPAAAGAAAAAAAGRRRRRGHHRFRDPGSAHRPTITAEGEAGRLDDCWRGRLGAAARCGRRQPASTAYWPQGLVAGSTRDWMTQNVTAGLDPQRPVADRRPKSPAALDRSRLTGLTGTSRSVDATVHWLRPVPPIQGVSGSAEFTPAEITLRGRGGRQVPPTAAGRDRAAEGTVRFTASTPIDEQAEIIGADVRAAARDLRPAAPPAPQAVRAAASWQPQAAGGQAEARLAVGFPLLRDLPMEALKIGAHRPVTEARLPGALVDRDVERGNFDLAVDTDGLKLNGQALLVGCAGAAGPGDGFPRRRPVPGDRARHAGRPVRRGGRSTRWASRRGQVLAGPVALEARYERRRNGQGQRRAARRPARGPAGAWRRWTGPSRPGTPGHRRGHAAAAGRQPGQHGGHPAGGAGAGAEGPRRLRPEGPAGTLRADRGQLRQLPLHRRGAAGRSGTAAPGRPGCAARCSTCGRCSADRPAGARPATADDGAPPLLLDLRFDRVTMGEGRNLLGVQARARRPMRAACCGKCGRPAAPRRWPARRRERGRIRLTLAPRGQQRLLRLTAEDGGALLQALDLTDRSRAAG